MQGTFVLLTSNNFYTTMMAENDEAPTVANLIIVRRNGKDSSHPRELTVDDEEMLVGR